MYSCSSWQTKWVGFNSSACRSGQFPYYNLFHISNALILFCWCPLCLYSHPLTPTHTHSPTHPLTHFFTQLQSGLKDAKLGQSPCKSHCRCFSVSFVKVSRPIVSCSAFLHCQPQICTRAPRSELPPRPFSTALFLNFVYVATEHAGVTKHADVRRNLRYNLSNP